ncbi:MAG: signal recognition particle-docking protein FtsY [Spirochaetota bacterium]
MQKKNLGKKLTELFGLKGGNEVFFNELEDLLIEGDIGAPTAVAVVDELMEISKKQTLKTKEEFQRELKHILKKYLKTEKPLILDDDLNFFLILGVNGVGKTTTIAKLAVFYSTSIGLEKIILSAGDTFRAAAIDQLKILGGRIGARVVAQEPGADPGAVIFDSIESAKSKAAKLIIADTAGRMHNKANLVKELQKIDKVVKGKIKDTHYKKMLVVDATTGQNALRQAETFHEAVRLDSIILTKYDSTAKGGIAFSISKNLRIPFAFIGTGEKLNDLLPFSTEDYLDTLLDIE